MRYGSVCSGIEAASCAWEPLRWEAAWFAEIEPFPSAVLAHHHPNVKNLGDFTQIGEKHGPIDLLVGGTPCQAFSVAGQRAGLGDPRGNLAIEFLRLAQRLRPRWILWENVPGVYSSWSDASEGEEVYEAGMLRQEVADFWQDSDFDTFLTLLEECGYGWAYRTLDAQYFGVPQRRRRVFVVGYLGDWRRAAAVLFERESLSGHPAPRREKRQAVAGSLAPGAHPGGFNGQDAYSGQRVGPGSRGFEVGPGSNRFTDTAPTLDARAKDGPIRNQIGAGVLQETGFAPKIGHNANTGLSQDVAHTLTSRIDSSEDGNGRGLPLVLGANNHGMRDVSTSLSGSNQRLDGAQEQAVAFTNRGTDTGELAETVRAGSHGAIPMTTHMSVRRLTPGECESLQGFPRGWTDVPFRGKPAADGPRYRAIGNSMAVPVMRWIGQRIEQVDSIERKERENDAT